MFDRLESAFLQDVVRSVVPIGGDTRPGTSMYVTCMYRRRPRRRNHGISGRRLVEMLRDSSRES